MTVRTGKLLSALVCCFSVSIVLLLTAQFQATNIAGKLPGSSWFSTTNLNHGGFHSWRIDHITQLVARIFGEYNPAERPTIGTVIFFLGTYFFLRAGSQLFYKNSPYLWMGSSLTTICLLLIIGFDAIAVGSVAWIPATATVAYRSMSGSYRRLSLAILAVLALEMSLSANQATILSAGISLWLAQLLCAVNGDTPRNRATIALMVLLPAMFVTFSAPLAELPHYPKSGHVLPYEDSHGTLRPLIGQTYAFESLDRSATRTLYGERALTLSLVSIIGWLIAKGSRSILAVHLTKVGAALACLAALDTLLPESWASIAPVASLARLLPGATNYSLTSISLAFSVLLTATGCILSSRLLCILVVPLTALALTHYGSSEIFIPTLRAQGATQNDALRPILLSPSVNILRLVAQSGEDIPQWLNTLRDFSHLTGTDHRTLNASVEIYPTPAVAVVEQAKQMEHVWRWSTRTGSQRGDEMLTVRLKTPSKIRGIELDPGPFFTDYPRGLRVHAGTCDQETAPVVAEYTVWHGSALLTRGGFPYYAPRNNVKIVLSNPSIASCIFVYQTGKAQFDWSVSRIKILIENSLEVMP